jgi:DnaK suppressor protein
LKNVKLYKNRRDALHASQNNAIFNVFYVKGGSNMANKTKAKTKAVAVKKVKPQIKAKAKVSAKIKVKAATKGKGSAKPKTAKVTAIKASGKTKVIVAKKNKTAIKNKKDTIKKMTAKKTLKIKPQESSQTEGYMREQQLEFFATILKNWKEQLLQQADNTKHNMQDSSAMYADIADRAYQEEEFSRELRTRDRERKLAKKIDEAIERIKDKSYGFCEDCGAEIGVKRLEARPTATQCVECKTISELKEKQVGELEE